jgi:hypothetical protein
MKKNALKSISSRGCPSCGTLPQAAPCRQNAAKCKGIPATSEDVPLSKSVWPRGFTPFHTSIEDGFADPQAIRSGVYWTVIDTDCADDWNIVPQTRAVPHEGLLRIGHSSPVSLLSALSALGMWCTEDFNHKGRKIGRIEKTPGGFIATF